MRKKVLLIDDSRLMRRVVMGVLSGAGYDVVEAEDGRDGLQKISENQDAMMVICDLNMPRMDGLELLAAAQKGAQGSIPPFLMLTSEAQPALVSRAKEGGARGWIVKPFDPEFLLAAVRRVIG